MLGTCCPEKGPPIGSRNPEEVENIQNRQGWTGKICGASSQAHYRITDVAKLIEIVERGRCP